MEFTVTLTPYDLIIVNGIEIKVQESGEYQFVLENQSGAYWLSKVKHEKVLEGFKR